MKRYRRHAAPLGKRRTAEEIAKILEQHRRSGLSLLAFAHKHQLCYTTLLRWRRSQTKSARAAGPGFVPIQIETGSISSDYVLSWPRGRSLRIPTRFDPDALRQLLSVLEEQT
jgi:hypothetical protein